MKRKLVRLTDNPGMQGPFAWPFKVLRDLFAEPPFVADPDFTPFDLDALRRKRARHEAPHPAASPLNVLNLDRAKLVLLIWFLELIVLPLLVLALLDRFNP